MSSREKTRENGTQEIEYDDKQLMRWWFLRVSFSLSLCSRDCLYGCLVGR